MQRHKRGHFLIECELGDLVRGPTTFEASLPIEVRGWASAMSCSSLMPSMSDLSVSYLDLMHGVCGLCVLLRY